MIETIKLVIIFNFLKNNDSPGVPAGLVPWPGPTGLIARTRSGAAATVLRPASAAGGVVLDPAATHPDPGLSMAFLRSQLAAATSRTSDGAFY